MKKLSKTVLFTEKHFNRIFKISGKLKLTFSGTINYLVEEALENFKPEKINNERLNKIINNFKRVGRPSNVTGNLEIINDYIQARLKAEKKECVSVVEASKWLEEANLLKDNPKRKGLALRNILRNESQREKIIGVRQVPPSPQGRWVIYSTQY